jgi:hypothetical protein
LTLETVDRAQVAKRVQDRPGIRDPHVGMADRRRDARSAVSNRAIALVELMVRRHSRLVGSGSEPQGWAAVLNRLRHGPYRVVAISTFRAAVAAAARAIRLTRRPVGLLVCTIHTPG